MDHRTTRPEESAFLGAILSLLREIQGVCSLPRHLDAELAGAIDVLGQLVGRAR